MIGLYRLTTSSYPYMVQQPTEKGANKKMSRRTFGTECKARSLAQEQICPEPGIPPRTISVRRDSLKLGVKEFSHAPSSGSRCGRTDDFVQDFEARPLVRRQWASLHQDSEFCKSKMVLDVGGGKNEEGDTAITALTASVTAG